VEAQQDDPASTLSLYRRALAARPSLFVNDSPVEWIQQRDGVLAFARGYAQCWVNTGPDLVVLPADLRIVLASDDTAYAGILPPDTALWATGGQSR
jgi:alpha-glucosidase